MREENVVIIENCLCHECKNTAECNCSICFDFVICHFDCLKKDINIEKNEKI